MRGGNAYFIKNAKGNIVLIAADIKEHDRPIAGFKRRYRKAEGIKRLKRQRRHPDRASWSRSRAQKASGCRAHGGGADTSPVSCDRNQIGTLD